MEAAEATWRPRSDFILWYDSPTKAGYVQNFPWIGGRGLRALLTLFEILWTLLAFTTSKRKPDTKL